MSIAQNTALFSLLGTTYGGNGVQTFGLPNFASRTAVGTGTGAGLNTIQLGEMAGTETVTLLSTEMPVHTHVPTTNASANGPTGNDASGTFLASSTRGITMPSIYVSAGTGSPMGPDSVTTTPVGQNQPHTNLQPFLGMNYIICLYGIFPSRN